MTRLATLAAMAPTRIELVPWTDRKNRFHPLRATVFGLLLFPGLSLLVRWQLHDLGAEPVNAAIHSTGYATVWLLLASLAVSPLKALSSLPNVAVVRRMVGNAALAYAAVHLALYAMDQHWRLLTIAAEIVTRFYLTIGFVALLGLFVLGFTSTDAWARSLGATWKRLHKLVYAIMALGLVHYLLQSKLDVSQSLLAGGVFTWLMLWRALPAGRDREWPPLLGISVAAALVTLAYEAAWYHFGTKVDALKVLRGEFDVEYGLHPAGQVLLLGLAATAGTVLRRLSMRVGGTLPFTLAVYVLGALAFDAGSMFRGVYFDDVFPDGPAPWVFDAGWAALFAVLAVMRWRGRNPWPARAVDAVWLAAIVLQVAIPGPLTRGPGAASAVIVLGAGAMLGPWLWALSRGAGMLALLLTVALAAEAATRL